jgi:hypothetical protein
LAKIRILFSRYSAFYSPLVATQAGGFLAAEGSKPSSRSPAPARRRAHGSPTAASI